MEPYSSVAEATTYLADVLYADDWSDASSTDKLRALKTATRAIDRLNFYGVKHAEWLVEQETSDCDALATARLSQERQFPRGSDTEVPQAIKDACCEEALSLLGGKDAAQELEDLAVISQGYSSVRTTYDRSFAQEHLNAGIVSPKAWHLLRPFIRDGRRINLRRV